MCCAGWSLKMMISSSRTINIGGSSTNKLVSLWMLLLLKLLVTTSSTDNGTTNRLLHVRTDTPDDDTDNDDTETTLDQRAKAKMADASWNSAAG